MPLDGWRIRGTPWRVRSKRRFAYMRMCQKFVPGAKGVISVISCHERGEKVIIFFGSGSVCVCRQRLGCFLDSPALNWARALSELV